MSLTYSILKHHQVYYVRKQFHVVAGFHQINLVFGYVLKQFYKFALYLSFILRWPTGTIEICVTIDDKFSWLQIINF